ncbi:hypothetical protein PHJA_001310900 [Phtheirospermum japonicum]|uniref:Uncharacterized protein n=1 Tax=Phtheirospermum japonicum TaxID=374723 RepID=A0A830BYL1_9LAMI|nr:hypothetical protein PHJA_001310900 [Phtheirospermum japonicum]
MVKNSDEGNHYTCKIDLKTWQFWGKKGLKTFTVADKHFDVFWDLRAAKFTCSPQPNSDYYVAMVCSEEVVLLLGDQKIEVLRRTKSRPSLEDALLVHKKELVFAKKCFCMKTTLGQDKKEHSIVIESSTGPTTRRCGTAWTGRNRSACRICIGDLGGTRRLRWKISGCRYCRTCTTGFIAGPIRGWAFSSLREMRVVVRIWGIVFGMCWRTSLARWASVIFFMLGRLNNEVIAFDHFVVCQCLSCGNGSFGEDLLFRVL